MKSLEEYLKGLELKYEVFRPGNHFEKVLLRRQNENGQAIADKCWKCIIIYNGKIGRSEAEMFSDDFYKFSTMKYPNNNA